MMKPMTDMQTDRRFAEELPASEANRLITLRNRSLAADQAATAKRRVLRNYITDLRGRGRSMGKIADVLGMSRQTLYKITDE